MSFHEDEPQWVVVCQATRTEATGEPRMIGRCWYRETMRALVVRSGLLVGSLVLSLAVVEAGLRPVVPLDPFGSRLALRPHVSMRLEVDLRGVSRNGRHSTNAWGLRGDAPPPPDAGSYRIITVGGSTTQCFYLDDHKTWPYLLQMKLSAAGWRVWIGNGGLDGHSTRGHLVFMEDVVARIRPDAIIVLAGINDLLYSLDERRRLRGSRYDRTGWLTVVYRRSRLAQVLYAWSQVVFGAALRVRRSGHGNFEPRPLSGDAAETPKNVMTLLPGLPEYRVNLKRIIALSKSSGVRCDALDRGGCRTCGPENRRVSRGASGRVGRV